MKKNELFQRGHTGPSVATDAGRVPPHTYASEVTAKNLRTCSSAEARGLLSYELAEKYQALPLGLVKLIEGELLLVAVHDSSDKDLLSTLQFATGKRVRLAQVNSAALKEAIFIAYHDQDASLVHSVNRLQDQSPLQSGMLRQSPAFRGASGDVAQFFERLMDYAIAKQASDVHLLPRHDGSYVKLRINGELYSHAEPIGSLALHQQLISRIKILSNLDITCRAVPQDGSLRVPIGSRNVNVRVSVMPTIHGEKVVLRIAGSHEQVTLESLELPAAVSEHFDQILTLPEGALFFSGPTGSGKTTTMYALLSELANRNLHVVSVEDPVEMQLPGVTQTEICLPQKLDYATCLRSVLRQDPNVIMVGEIRDAESAKIALQAALSGHLIISTVHARSALEVFLRLGSLGIDSVTMSQALRLVVNQRLFPRLCEKCKVFDLNISKSLDLHVYRQVGCSTCDYSGFSGRVMAVESILVDTHLAQAIQCEGLSLEKLRKHIVGENYATIQQSVTSILSEGKISYDHAKPWVNHKSS